MALATSPEAMPANQLPEMEKGDPLFPLQPEVQEHLNGKNIYQDLHAEDVEKSLSRLKSAKEREELWHTLREKLTSDPEALARMQERFPSRFNEEGKFDFDTFSDDLNALGTSLNGKEQELLGEVKVLQQRANVLRQAREGTGETVEEKAEQKTFMQKSFDVVRSVATYPIRHPVKTALIVLIGSAVALAGGAYMAGGWEAMLQKVGLSTLFGSAGATEAAKQMGNLITDAPWANSGGM